MFVLCLVFVFCHWLIPCLQHRASPRNAHAFTGFSGNSTRDGPGGPSGTLLLAVTNSAIPCTLEGMSTQKFVSFTVLNIRKKGWIYAPWCVISVFYSRLSRANCFFYRKKPAKNAKTIRDDQAKELFENDEWARNGEPSPCLPNPLHAH